MRALREGRFDTGWADYEDRFEQGLPKPALAQPRWRGEPLGGKRLLVHREQGVGDEILYASGVPDLLGACAHLELTCDARLEPLFRRSFPAAALHPGKPNALDDAARLAALEVDFQTPAGSAMRYLRDARERFPRRAFLRADPARVAAWRARLDALGAGPKVGISWQGGRDLLTLRRAPWSFWHALLTDGAARSPRPVWVNLQYGDCRAQLDTFRRDWGVPVHDLGIDLWRDLDQAAALLVALDRVLTVPNLNAHLAGAVGAATRVLFTAKWGCWWILRGEEILWYPDARVLARDAARPWDRIAADLGRDLDAGSG